MDALLNNVVDHARRPFDKAFKRPQNAFTFVDGSSRAALTKVMAGYPDAKVTTGPEFEKSRADGLGTILKMLYVLLGFSVIVSLFGLVNTLVLAVYERTRELGMLRAVGMTRRQARRMIRQESIITALIGAAMGILLGVFLAALITQALSKYGVSLELPLARARRVHGGGDRRRGVGGDRARAQGVAPRRAQRPAVLSKRRGGAAMRRRPSFPPFTGWLC